MSPTILVFSYEITLIIDLTQIIHQQADKLSAFCFFRRAALQPAYVSVRVRWGFAPSNFNQITVKYVLLSAGGRAAHI